MSTVPRPERAPRPSEADELRELLAAIVEALDVSVDGDYAATLQLTRDRSIIVKHVAEACTRSVLPADPARWVRTSVAEIAPGPEAVHGE